MELVNERIREHLLQIEKLTKMKAINNEKNDAIKENIDKIKTVINYHGEDPKVLQKLCQEHPDKRAKICLSDYELLLSKVVVDIYEDIQLLKK